MLVTQAWLWCIKSSTGTLAPKLLNQTEQPSNTKIPISQAVQAYGITSNGEIAPIAGVIYER